MHFMTKDLLVTVLPKASEDLLKACLFRTHICRNPTFCINASRICGAVSFCRFNSCGGITDFCNPRSFGCFPGISCDAGSGCNPTLVDCLASNDPLVLEHIEDLVAFRAELKETLTQLDAIEKQGLPSRISSMAEADALERSLKEALDQVSKAKNKLK